MDPNANFRARVTLARNAVSAGYWTRTDHDHYGELREAYGDWISAGGFPAEPAIRDALLAPLTALDSQIRDSSLLGQSLSTLGDALPIGFQPEFLPLETLVTLTDSELDELRAEHCEAHDHEDSAHGPHGYRKSLIDAIQSDRRAQARRNRD